jgi:hypothetical protein
LTLDPATTHLGIRRVRGNCEWTENTLGGTCPRMAIIELRAASDTDSEFCYQLHKAAMGAYVTAIWGWDEQAQRDFHARAFNPDRWKIITSAGSDIGMLDVEYRRLFPNRVRGCGRA